MMTEQEIEQKREQEIKTAKLMVAIYCHGKHHTAGELCPECQELASYVALRTKKCPRMAVKTFCSACPIHCYKPDMRVKIQEVMRYSGPRMLLHEPALALKHLYIQLKEALK